MSKLIVGTGTGRCGTVTFSKLLGLQVGIRSSHELNIRAMGTEPSLPPVTLERLLAVKPNPNQHTVADTSFFWVPLMQSILENTDATIVFLERDREEVIDSFLRKTNYERNHWQEHDGTFFKHHVFDAYFPKFDPSLSISDAIGAYWDYCHCEYERVKALFPDRVIYFPTKALKNETATLELLALLGIENPVYKDIHVNRAFGVTKHKVISGGLGNQMHEYINVKRALRVKPDITYSFQSICTPREFGLNWFAISTHPVRAIRVGGQSFNKCKIDDFAKQVILSEFIPNATLTPDENTFMEKVRGRFVVHVRKGDFVKIGWDIPTSDYIEMCGTNNPVIISDDTEWCKANLSGLGEVVETKHLHPAAILHALGFSSGVSGHPRSSFAYWGEILRKARNGTL